MWRGGLLPYQNNTKLERPQNETFEKKSQATKRLQCNNSQISIRQMSCVLGPFYLSMDAPCFLFVYIDRWNRHKMAPLHYITQKITLLNRVALINLSSPAQKIWDSSTYETAYQNQKKRYEVNHEMLLPFLCSFFLPITLLLLLRTSLKCYH